MEKSCKEAVRGCKGQEVLDIDGIAVLSIASTAQATGGPSDHTCGSHQALWYCAQTHRFNESRACRELARQGFRAWFPQRRMPATPRKPSTIGPLFPCYIFVAFDADRDGWGVIRSTYGVTRLISTWDGLPAPLPPTVVERLMARSGLDSAFEVAASEAVRIVEGDLLEILDGPFARFQAMCAASADNRVKVLVDIFGRTTRIELDTASVQRISR